MSDFTHGAADWLLRLLTVGAGVLLAGWLAVRASRAAATRQRIASAAIRAALLVPVLSCLPTWLWIPLPRAAEPVVAAESLASKPTDVPLHEPPFGLAQPEPAPIPDPESTAVDSQTAALEFDWRLVLVLGHGTISLILLAQLAHGHRSLRRLWRDSRPLPDRLAAVCDGVSAEVRLSGRVGSAVCFGFTRPLVLLPLAFARNASAAELRWVLAHEGDHARRGDHRAAYWVGLCRAALFLAPWFWLLRRELRLAQEYLADAAAARAEPAEYAAFLVGLSASEPFRPRLAATGVGATRSDLYRRVTMLLSPHPAARRASRLWAGVVATAMTAVVVLASGVGLTAAPADEPKEKPADPARAKPKLLPADPAEVKPLDPRELQKKLTEMIRNGNPDPDEMRRLIEEMNGLMMEQLKRGLGGDAFQLQRQGLFNPAVPAKPALREQYEKRLKQFDEDIAKNADNADAQVALKKARDAYAEAMAAELKKADEEAKKNPAAVGRQFPNVPNFPFGGGNIEVIPFPAFPEFPGIADPFAGRAGGVRPRATRLGIQVEKPTPALSEQLDLPAETGVVVAAVVAGTPGEKAGLRKNDVVVKVAGKDAPSDPAAFTALVGQLKAGEKFDVDILRKGKRETLKGLELAEPRKPAAVGGGRLIADRGGFNQVQVQVTDGDVTIQATADGVTFDITGTLEDGKAVPAKIVIDDDGKKEYPSLEKVPDKHRPAVEKLLGRVRGLRR